MQSNVSHELEKFCLMCISEIAVFSTITDNESTATAIRIKAHEAVLQLKNIQNAAQQTIDFLTYGNEK